MAWNIMHGSTKNVFLLGTGGKCNKWLNKLCIFFVLLYLWGRHHTLAPAAYNHDSVAKQWPGADPGFLRGGGPIFFFFAPENLKNAPAKNSRQGGGGGGGGGPTPQKGKNHVILHDFFFSRGGGGPGPPGPPPPLDPPLAMTSLLWGPRIKTITICYISVLLWGIKTH